jgi:2-dehydro-3-deoxyphosphogluconate aldolase/(4S)-4-hydroxy-2-oxoglutarate aldolase
MASLFAEYMEQRPLLALVRTHKEADLRPAFEALARGGVVLQELDFLSPRAEENLRTATEAYGTAICLGAGNIMELEHAQKALEAGAQFLTLSRINPECIAACREKSVPVFCSAFTPSEVLEAHQAGADYVRLFPAQLHGPEYLRLLVGQFPFVRLVPQGGVSLQNLNDWWKSGAHGLCLSGTLFNDALLTLKQWATLEKNARAYADGFDEVRAEYQ